MILGLAILIAISNPISGQESLRFENVKGFIPILNRFEKRVEVTGTHEQFPIHWRSYSEGRKEATKTKKPMILLFIMPGCPWSDQYLENINQDSKLRKCVENQFVPILIECKYQDGLSGNAALVNALRVTGFPTTILASPDGKILLKIPGLQKATVLHLSLKHVLKDLGSGRK